VAFCSEESARVQLPAACDCPVGGNACPAVKTGLEDDFIPARDLLLIREGIDDYRTIYTLDRLVREAVRHVLALQKALPG
jgi:hypothetical protein